MCFWGKVAVRAFYQGCADFGVILGRIWGARGGLNTSQPPVENRAPKPKKLDGVGCFSGLLIVV